MKGSPYRLRISQFMGKQIQGALEDTTPTTYYICLRLKRAPFYSLEHQP